MNHIKKCFSLALICIFAMVSTAAATDNDAVKVILDGRNMTFNDVKPYLDSTAGRVMVPLRALMEALGADVDYDPETSAISISDERTSIELITNDTHAIVNGADTVLDCPATVINSSTYVPLRFVSESMNLKVDWNGDTKTVSLTRNPHIELGISESDIISSLGAPDRTDASEKGFSWYVYSDDLLNYKQIGIFEKKVAAYYLHAQTFVHQTGIRSGISRTDCNVLMKSKGYTLSAKNSYSIYRNDENAITVYFDGESKCYAMMVEDIKYHNLSRINSAVLGSFEKTLLDLVNIERAKAGLGKLESAAALSDVAKNHSTDMAEKNYYSHVNSDGNSPHQRLEAAGFSDFYSTEAISKAFPNSFSAFSSHLANSDYVSAMLARYTQFGAGCAFNADSDGILYYTQVFYTSK